MLKGKYTSKELFICQNMANQLEFIVMLHGKWRAVDGQGPLYSCSKLSVGCYFIHNYNVYNCTIKFPY
jgi:hypothetical protein